MRFPRGDGSVNVESLSPMHVTEFPLCDWSVDVLLRNGPVNVTA